MNKTKLSCALAIWFALAFSLSAVRADAQTSSNASNYGGGAHLSVNPRTGGLSVDVEIFRIHGIRDEVSAALHLSFRSEDAVSDQDGGTTVFGLPFGWALNLSYLENRGTYVELNVDGSQTYVQSDTWATDFTPTGATSSQSVKTGLKEYNKVDVQLREDAGTVTVGGIESAFVIRSQDGRERYLSGNGLLVSSRDRWGNEIQYFWNTDTTPDRASLAKIVDTWSNEITFATSPDSGGTRTTATLPDGRTVSWLVTAEGVTEIVDAQGKVTALSWASKCDYPMLTALTSPWGSSTGLEYQCMDVCSTRTGPSACTGQTTQWPVVASRYECPTVETGGSCPTGAAKQDYLTATYEFGGTSSAPGEPNYTGYPYYSPYDTQDPAADALMETNDTTFTYTSVEVKRHADESAAHKVERGYNFLHLETEEASYLPDSSGNLTVLSRAKSSCYQVSSEAPDSECSLPTAVDYALLPANYQEPVRTGTCVFGVSESDTTGARVSVMTEVHDSFGDVVRRSRYHGTGETAIVPANECTRQQRLDPSNLQRVFDVYLQHDQPTSVDSDGYVQLGASAGKYGLLVGAQGFFYPDASSALDTASAQSTGTPVRVVLTCRDTGAGGRAVTKETFGELSTSATLPTEVGIVSACSSPSWDATLAPPKAHSFTYDSNGRALTKVLSWGAGEKPGGVTSRTTTFTYTQGGSEDGEESCDNVLEKTETDDNGHTTTTRVCTQNSFELSVTDAEGRRLLFEHDEMGLVTRRTLPNGSYHQTDYYYTCGNAPDGAETCPSGSTASANCPHDDTGENRSCVVHTIHAGVDPSTGEPNSSYADGVTSVELKDGLGRHVERLDDLGGSGSNFTAFQRRGTSTYDSLGLVTAETNEVGTSSPLVYESTIEYGMKYRPRLTCGPRGVAAEIVRDDVGQGTLGLTNGHAHTGRSYNDIHKTTLLEDCAIGTSVPTTGAGACPTVASSSNSVDCPGQGYLTAFGWDGSGVEMSRTASDPNAAQNGASIESVTGTPVFSADLLKYGFDTVGTTVEGEADVSGNGSWTRDINGHPLMHTLTIAADEAASDVFDYDGVGNEVAAQNPLGAQLTETNTYSRYSQDLWIRT